MCGVTESVPNRSVALTFQGVKAAEGSSVEVVMDSGPIPGEVRAGEVKLVVDPKVAVAVSKRRQLSVKVHDGVCDVTQLVNVVRVEGIVDGHVVNNEVVVYVHYVAQVVTEQPHPRLASGTVVGVQEVPQCQVANSLR